MRTILIITESTLPHAAAQVALAGQSDTLVGLVAVGLVEAPADAGGRSAPAGSASATMDGGPAVLGTVGDLGAICAGHGVERAIVCLPGALRDVRVSVRAELRRLGVVQRDLAPLLEALSCEPAPIAPAPVSGSSIDLAALVGRRPHPIDEAMVGALIRDRTVLVTGAGGSIGSELVAVCARFGPAKLVLMERAENALFEIDRCLREKHPAIDRATLLHDVVDADRTRALVDEHRPDVVLHAAAHKHVPLMEDHPAHALTNNVFGTKSIADASVAAGVSHFVLISSDKAVNPTSVMGATKRLAEVYVQGLADGRRSGTRLCMVRFGNVLGSACSVLPIWSAQISEGGPVTVTDERMTRYFMTIPEAASLVVQAAAMSGSADPGRSGEVFVLDMGEPVNVLTLAQRFVRACGFEPVLGQASVATARPTVDIVLSGARPGEKLSEELAYAAESLGPTAHPGVLALASSEPASSEQASAMIAALSRVRVGADRQAIVEAIRAHVPELKRGISLIEPRPGVFEAA